MSEKRTTSDDLAESVNKTHQAKQRYQQIKNHSKSSFQTNQPRTNTPKGNPASFNNASSGGSNSKGVEQTTKKTAEALGKTPTVAVSPEALAAEAVKRTLSKIGTLAQKQKATKLKDSSEGKTIGKVFGIILVVVTIVFAPIILIGILLVALFSVLFSNDITQENQPIAYESFLYKTSKDLAGFDLDSIVTTQPKATIVVRLSQEPIETRPTVANIYLEDSTTAPVMMTAKEGDVFEGADTTGSQTGGFTKVQIVVAENNEWLSHPKIQKLETNPHQTNTTTSDAEGLTTKQVVIYGYIERKYTDTSQQLYDKYHQYTIDDEYRLMGTALQLLISDRYSEARSIVNDKLSGFALNPQYNGYLLDTKELEEKDIVYINDANALNPFDPEAPEFDIAASLSAVQDLGRGTISTANVAEILSAYSVSRQESLPEKGYYKELDTIFPEYLKSQYAVTVQEIKPIQENGVDVLFERKLSTHNVQQQSITRKITTTGLMQLAVSDTEKTTANYQRVERQVVSTYMKVQDRYYKDLTTSPAIGYIQVAPGEGEYFLDSSRAGTVTVFITEDVPVLSPAEEKTYTYKKYVAKTSIAPFSVDNLTAKFFQSPQSDYRNKGSYEEILKLDYHKQELHYVYDNTSEEVQKYLEKNEKTIESCPTTGVDAISSCNASPQRNTAFVFWDNGPVQQYVVKQEPEVYYQLTSDDNQEIVRPDPVVEEDEDEIATAPVDVVEIEHPEQPFSIDLNSKTHTVKSRIKYFSQNILEVLSGITLSGQGDGQQMVEVARSQMGVINGLEYQNWHYKNNIPGGWQHWCAVFTSWVANQLGFIDQGIVPNSARVFEYIQFYKEQGLFYANGANYVPRQGDFVFYDWNFDGRSDHIEIVAEVTDKTFVSIGGNTGNGTVRTSPPGVVHEHTDKPTEFNSPYVFGFAAPAYPSIDSDPEETILQFVLQKQDNTAKAKTEGYGILEWANQPMLALWNKIKAQEPVAYESLTKGNQSPPSVQKYLKQALEAGAILYADNSALQQSLQEGDKKDRTNARGQLDQVLTKESIQTLQKETAEALVRQTYQQLSAYKTVKGDPLTGRALAYLVDLVVDSKAKGYPVSLETDAFKNKINEAVSGGATLDSTHAAFKEWAPDQAKNQDRENFLQQRRVAYSHLYRMDESSFIISSGAGTALTDGAISGEWIVAAGGQIGATIQPCPLFKPESRSHMDYRALTNKASKQYRLQYNPIQGKTTTTDPSTGIRMWNGRYIVAMGSVYGETGTMLDLQLGNRIVPVIIGDTKSIAHLNVNKCQHQQDGSVVELIVDTRIGADYHAKNVMTKEGPFQGSLNRVVYRGSIAIPTSWNP